MMNERVNLGNSEVYLSEEYFRKKNESSREENEAYFPLEESKPPHY